MMARRKSQLTTGPIPQRMQFAGGSSGYLDPTAQPLPETELQIFFRDEKAVAQFSQPVRSRQNAINEAGR